jgi:hypothetical protein
MQAAHNSPATFGKCKMLRVLGEGSTSVVARALHQQKGESYGVTKIVKLIEVGFVNFGLPACHKAARRSADVLKLHTRA